MKRFFVEVIYAVKRFLIMASGGYMRYSDIPYFEEKVAKELEKLRASRAINKRVKDEKTL